MNRQILAHQVDALADPLALQTLAADQVAGGVYRRGGTGNNGVTPLPVIFVVRGAVGYEPVIEFLPEGATCMVKAVISADRRHFRITSMPFFPGVSSVSTFNMAIGANESTTTGTGNSGYNDTFSGSSSGTGGTAVIGGVCFGGLYRDIQEVPQAAFPERGRQGQWSSSRSSPICWGPGGLPRPGASSIALTASRCLSSTAATAAGRAPQESERPIDTWSANGPSSLRGQKGHPSLAEVRGSRLDGEMWASRIISGNSHSALP